MRRLVVVTLLLAATLVAPPARAVVAVSAGLPAGARAGDYLLRATVLATSPGVVEITQQVGGRGPALRVADLHVGTTPATVTAEVRVTDAADVFRAAPRVGIASASFTLSPAKWGYVVRGTHVLAPATNQAVALRGINPALGIDAGALRATLAAYPGIRLVRIDAYEQCWDPFFTTAQADAECNEWDGPNLRGAAAYRNRFQEMVNVVLAAGRVALVGVDLPGADSPRFADGDTAHTVLPDQHTLSLFDDLVRLYGGNPNVMFETMNEPKTYATVRYPPTGRTGASLWRDGGTITARGVTWNAPGVQQQVQRIRADGATNVIMVQGPDWGADLTPLEANPVDGANLVLSYHAYNPGRTAPSSDLDRLVAPLIDPAGPYAYAGYMSEFGTQLQGTSGATYEQAAITWANNHQTAWAAWGWFPISWGDQYALVDGFRGGAPVLLPKGAAVVKQL